MELSAFCIVLDRAQDYANGAVDELLEIVKKRGGSIDFSAYESVRNCPYLMRDVFGNIGIEWLTSISVDDGCLLVKSKENEEDVISYDDPLLLYNLSEIYDMLDWINHRL